MLTLGCLGGQFEIIMNLQELKKLIDFALIDCQRIIRKNPKVILSEGDLERLLSSCISKRIGYVPENPAPDSFAVYSQISHYNNENNVLDARVDLLLMKPNKINKSYDHNKNFVYSSDESFAIELKYLHANNNGCVTSAKRDIDKYIRYKDDSYYYSVVLLDYNDDFSNYSNQIKEYYKEQKDAMDKNSKKKFFCKVLKKVVDNL